VIVGAKQAARNRAGPQASGLVRPACFQRPNQAQRRRHRRLAVAGDHLIAFAESRYRAFGPGVALIGRALQLVAEMAKIEHRVPAAVAGVD